jgi:hypothetical protein
VTEITWIEIESLALFLLLGGLLFGRRRLFCFLFLFLLLLLLLFLLHCSLFLLLFTLILGFQGLAIVGSGECDVFVREAGFNLGQNRKEGRKLFGAERDSLNQSEGCR